MKTIGVIGGIGPESTVEYYRLLIAGYQERQRDGSYPSVVINSINLKKMVDWFTAGQLAEVVEYLVAELRRLAAAGADVGEVQRLGDEWSLFFRDPDGMELEVCCHAEPG
jgi:aspartate racemase